MKMSTNKQSGFGEMQSEVGQKRLRTPTFKGIRMAMERLQTERNSNITQSSKLKTQITALMDTKGNILDVQLMLERFKCSCQKAAELHNTLLSEFPMPEEEQSKQNTWIQAKMLGSEMFMQDVSKWLSENRGINYDGVNANKVLGLSEHECVNADGANKVLGPSVQCQDNINPEDSVSNVSRGSKRSKASSKGSGSGVSSACMRAKAEKAALLEKAAALQKRHEIEAEEEKLRKRKEQLDLDTQIRAANARVSVLEGSDVGGKALSNTMGSYVSKGQRHGLQFNPTGVCTKVGCSHSRSKLQNAICFI